MVIFKHKANDKDDCKSAKTIAFREITKVSLPKPDEDNLIRNLDCEQPWCFCFFMHTNERKYYIYAQSSLERDIWVSAFHFLVVSTEYCINCVQKIKAVK